MLESGSFRRSTTVKEPELRFTLCIKSNPVMLKINKAPTDPGQSLILRERSISAADEIPRAAAGAVLGETTSTENNGRCRLYVLISLD